MTVRVEPVADGVVLAAMDDGKANTLSFEALAAQRALVLPAADWPFCASRPPGNGRRRPDMAR